MIPWSQMLSRIAFEDLQPQGEHAVRFGYPQPLQTPLHWAMVLDEAPDVSRLMPDAPDREAVASLLAGLRHALLESFEQGWGSALFTTAGIDDPAAWRDVLLDHYCRPRWIYTNGQQTLSLVEREGPRFEVARLPSLGSLHELHTLYVRDLPDPREVVTFGHVEGAQTYVLERLSHVEMQAVPLLHGKQRRTLWLQACGRRSGGRGRAEVSLHLAHVGGTTHLLEMQPDRRDAYTVLNRLPGLRPGEVPQVCATCASFRFSGMSRGSSGGKKGYCRRRLEAARASGLPMPGMDVRPRYGTIVSVLDRCEAHEPIADDRREIPFCQRGGGDE